jgi:hypothetical protein
MEWISLSEVKDEPGVESMRADYWRVLAETGTTVEMVRTRVLNPDTQIPMPPGFEFLEVRPSPIEGMGLFTTKAIAQGEVIGPAVIAGRRTPLGRYANHSPCPNTAFRVLPNGDSVSFALRDIPAHHEVLNNYRQGAHLCGSHFEPVEIAKTLELRAQTLSLGSDTHEFIA